MSKRFKRQFGGKMTPRWEEKYTKSPQWDRKKFVNTLETKLEINWKTLPGLIVDQIKKDPNRSPHNPIEVPAFDQERWSALDQGYCWMGHSAALLKMGGKTLCVDPMLGPDTAPISPTKNPRFWENSLEYASKLPQIDAVFITHDHYDHLDMDSIDTIAPKVSNWFVSLGVARHLIAWGIPEESIVELDWWNSTEWEGIRITATPNQHFSGRGLLDRTKSLWCGWVLETEDFKLYWSGDGGYGPHFKEIGEKLGPFDFGFIECGQYNPNWHAIHMYPEESVQAALDTGCKKAVPVHWGGFVLALHSWTDPVTRFVAQAEKDNLHIATPRIGAIHSFDVEVREEWWNPGTWH